MATANLKLSGALKTLKRLQDKQDGAVESADLPEAQRKLLVDRGFLRPVVKGWYGCANPADAPGDSTVWYASFWAFLAGYLRKRFGKRYCLEKRPRPASSRRAGGGLKALGFALFLIQASVAWSQSSAYSYGKRGEGATLRFEGVKSEPYGGSLTLLSFTIGRLATSSPESADRQLRVLFFTPAAASIRLRVRELYSVKSYVLDAKHAWKAGRSEFAWPVTDVVQPLQVDLNNLGVVVGSNPGMTGLVFPARFAGALPGGREPIYTAVIQSKYTCAPLLAELSQFTDKSRSRVASQSHREVAALVPKILEFDASGLLEGPYSLQVSCERKGMGAGAGADSHQLAVYDFHHVPSFVVDSPAGAARR